MRSKIGLNLSNYYSPNFNIKKRSKKTIKFIIIHYTGMKKELAAVNKLCSPKSKVSSHYFIRNNGNILNLVPDLYEAWHAGLSSWQNYKSLNKYSIGIEINNPGHDHGYKRFKSKQIQSLKKLLKILISKYKIKTCNILGHSDVAPNRKKDPGEKFPWKKLAKQNLCKWHDLDDRILQRHREIKLRMAEKKVFFRNLNRIGYSSISNSSNKIQRTNLIKAFQRRYRQSLINGKVDKECLLISKNLAE